MRVELRIEAREDLANAAVFYEDHREGLGDYFIDCLFVDLASLESQTGIHEVVHGLHRKLAGRFLCDLHYRVTEYVIDVVAILDCCGGHLLDLQIDFFSGQHP